MKLNGSTSGRVRTAGAEISFRRGGEGPPLLLLHGYPQNHAMWHQVAPRLARTFSVVVPDLRGYGESVGPPADAEHVNYSKRAMAQDMIELMAALGHHRFGVVGHDRGGRVAYRLALDHPERAMRLAVLDILPTLDVWESIRSTNALRSWHWLFLTQPAPLPERLIAADPEFFLSYILNDWVGTRDAFDPAAVAEYQRHFKNPSVIRAFCEDYRAGATVDLENDRKDRAAGRKIRCPLLLIWGRRFLGKHGGNPSDVWRQWCDDVREIAFDCGHFVAEEQPEACATALERFFAGAM